MRKEHLVDISNKHGTTVVCEGNTPLDLGNTDSIWLVESGAIDIFVTEWDNGEQCSPLKHFMRAETGNIVFGVAPTIGKTRLEVTAKGTPGTRLIATGTHFVLSARADDLAAHADRWILSLADMLTRHLPYPPRPDESLIPGLFREFNPARLSARRKVIWVVGNDVSASFLGLLPIELGSQPIVALAPSTWLDLDMAGKLRTVSSEVLAENQQLLAAMKHFATLALEAERMNRNIALVDQANLERDSGDLRREEETRARQDLRRLAGHKDEPTTMTRLFDVLAVIARHEGISLDYFQSDRLNMENQSLTEILDMNGIRTRPVRLDPKTRWWNSDFGAVLAYDSVSSEPVALIPSVLSGYRMSINAAQRGVAVDASVAAKLQPMALQLYPSLSERTARPIDIFRSTAAGSTPDAIIVIAAGLLCGITILAPAIILGMATDFAMAGDASAMSIPILAFAVASFGFLAAIFHLLERAYLARIECRSSSRSEALFWERLLRIPSDILRRYPAGDLAYKALAFRNLRDSIRTVIADSVLAVLFLSPALIIIMAFNPAAAAITAVFSLLMIVTAIMMGKRQFAPFLRRQKSIHMMAGRLMQIIGGISKLRIEQAEGSAFAVWARDVVKQKAAEQDLASAEGHSRSLAAALPLLAMAVLVAATSVTDGQAMTAGAFIAAAVALLAFVKAVERLALSFRTTAEILANFDELQPLICAQAESAVGGRVVSRLGGDVLVDNISFRYAEDGPYAVDSVTIRARPGEFVAIVGDSGSGKSSIFRLILGMIRPTSGAIYFDGQELDSLNLRQLRKHVGAVPQDVLLYPETIWDNIVGGLSDASDADAWRVATTADIDNEIRKMPMRMQTPIGANSMLTSGGESQRIMIAHMSIRNSRVLLLDEATNWLDNDSQAKIMGNLASISATRIVVAHRLSTIRNADRIYVMKAGRVVQSGNFEDLSRTKGIFRNLIQRQTL